MTLISILFALAADFFANRLHSIRGASWIEGYFQWFASRYAGTELWNSPTALLMVLLPVLAPALLLQLGLEDLWAGLPGFAAAVAVLWYCLGPIQISRELEHLTEARATSNRQDWQDLAEQTLGEPPEEDDSLLDIQCVEALLTQPNNQLFSILFWFVVLGPIGCLLVWLTTRLASMKLDDEQTGLESSVARLNWLLGWLPARITALAYSLVGSFDDSLKAWQAGSDYDTDPATNEGFLLRIGSAAIGRRASDGRQATIAPTLELAHLLVQRALIAGVTLVAALTLTGVLG